MELLLAKLDTSALVIALAAKGNPVIAALCVLLFYFAFNGIEGIIEKLIFGKYFVHWLDPIFALAFASYACLVVWNCAHVSKALMKL
jgi:hypothetical protein